MLSQERFLRHHIDRPQSLLQRRDRFQVPHHTDVLAVAHAAFDSAGPVREPIESTGVGIEGNLIMGGRTPGEGDPNSVADFHRLDRVDRHHSLREAAIQFLRPVDVCAQSDGDSSSNHLEATADRVAVLLGRFDLLDHAISIIGQDAAYEGIIPNRLQLPPLDHELFRQTDFPDGPGMTENLDPERSYQEFRHGPGCHPGGGLAGAGTLQNVSSVGLVELLGAGQVRVTRSRSGHASLLGNLGSDGFDRHDVAPVLPIAVLNHHRERTAERSPVPDTGEDSDLIRLDLHPAAAPETALSPVKLYIDEVRVEFQISGKPLDDGDERLTVGFASCFEAQHWLSIAHQGGAVLGCLTVDHKRDLPIRYFMLSPKDAVIEVQEIAVLTGRSFWGAFRRPFYFRDILIQMDRVGVGSLTIIMLTGFFTGAVLTLQMASTLSTFGAIGFTGSLVSVSLVRELGPVLAALMVAGRVGSGMASELGSMKVTEQINAMRALGTDPVKKLVVPRILATVTMQPLLTIVTNGMGIIGGLFVAVFLLQISSSLYLNSAWDALNYDDILGGLIKPVVFGAILATVSCYCGMRTYGGTRGVGRSTTQAVVVSSILILVSDFFLTRIILTYL